MQSFCGTFSPLPADLPPCYFAVFRESIFSDSAVPGDADTGQAAAEKRKKCSVSNGSNTVRDGNTGQIDASVKRPLPDGSNTVRDGNTGQIDASGKSPVIDFGDTGGNGY